MITQLEIAIQSTYDTNTGSGPIASALNWECATRLNKVGAFSFEMPLADSKRSLLVAKRYVRCYGIVNDAWTELGKPGIIERISRSIDGEGVPTGMIRVEGTDLFGELNDILIHELDIINTSTRIPDSVQYYDGTATAYLNMANAYDDNPATSVEIPADDEDWEYIGDADPFDIVTRDFGANLNSDTNNFIVQYSQGGASWGSGTILSDTTKVDNASYAQDGAIRWERQEDWATDTVNSVANLYWLRFRYKEDMSGDVTINEITITQEIPTATALTLWQEYVDVDSNTPISTLGWDFEATHTETQNTVFLKLREVSAFKALAMIAEQTGENFRLGSGREIEWLQDDKTASGIVATNAIDATAGASATTNCWITSFRQSSDAYELVGRVYPRGGGRGASRVNLLECTRDVPGDDYAGYVLSKSLNYLEKTSVESDYGRPIERAKYWPELMSPNAANAKDINVANALFDLTYQHLLRHYAPQTAYDLEVVKLDSAVPVGTTLQVAYWQTVDGSAIMDVGVDGTAVHLWVLESTQRVDNKGLRSVAMKIATTDAWPTSAGAKMQEVIYQVLAIQSTDGPMSAASLTVGSAADLLGSLDLSAYYKKPTNTTVVLGLDAGNVPPASNHGVFVGNEAGYSSTSGQDNTFLGYRTGYTTTTGYDNTIVGGNGMRLGNGTGNTGLGFQVLENVGTTSDGLLNTAVGHNAMRAMDEGDYNVAMGSDAMVAAEASNCVAVGYQALSDVTGDDNIAVGYQAGLAVTSAVYSVLIGTSVASTLVDGDSNVAIGWNAMVACGTDATANIAIGYKALENVGTSALEVSNVAIGHVAMEDMDGGSYNVAIGASAMENFTSGDCNVAIGEEALKSTATGSGEYNVAIGYNAMIAATSGHSNVAVGPFALGSITTGDYNIAIGREAMTYNAVSNNNIVIGYRAGYKGSATTYDDCVIIGYQAGYVLETGDNNVLIGHQAGLALTGAANVFIGYLAGSQAVGVSNQLYIANSNSATPLIYGEFDNNLVKIYGDLCLGSEDGGGRLNFTEGTAIADGIVWGSDANKVTLYRSADDMLKTDDSLTVALELLAIKAVGDYSDDDIAASFGDKATGNQLYIIGNTINCAFGADTDGNDLWVNYRGYDAAVTRFRDFLVGDGKGAAIATFAGSTGTLTMTGGLNVGTSTLGSAAGKVGMKGPAARLYMESTTVGQQCSIIVETPDGAGYVGIAGAAGAIITGTADVDFVVTNRTGGKIILSADAAHVQHHVWIVETGGVYNLADSADFNQVSDEILKTDIESVADALVSLRILEPITFRFNEEYLEEHNGADLSKIRSGFTAQNFAKVFPEQVSREGKYLSMNTGGLDALIVAAMQELDGQMVSADAEREAIRVRLDSIERRG